MCGCCASSAGSSAAREVGTSTRSRSYSVSCSGGAAPACADAADTNDTGNIEITHASIIFSWLFTGGAPPAAPSPVSPGYSAEECRGDPTDDALGCVSPSPVCQ